MKVYLKYNRNSIQSKFCLERWLKIFKKYKKCILTDIDADYTNLDISDCEFLQSNYDLVEPYQNCFFGERWSRPGAANLTAYENAKNEDAFWLIDADDTIIHHSDVSLIQAKLKSCEDYLIDNKLDGFSLDFYREFTGQWSFGVALLSGKIDLSLLNSFDDSMIPGEHLVWKNMDMIFTILRHSNLLRLESFVLDELGFSHLRPELESSYYWANGKLWDIELGEDIVII